MSRRTVYHVTRDKGGWKVTLKGAHRASARTDTRVEAVQRGKELARAAPPGQVIIHREDGVIQTEYTYGKDPERSKG
jgi:hypothetical protein